jgi:hypothetical protein
MPRRVPGIVRNLTLLLILAVESSCHNRTATKMTDLETSEPERYAARIVHTIEDDQGRRVSESRIARSADLLREEWSEQGQTIAMLWRPDIGKSFLLLLDKHEYVETAIAGAHLSESTGEISQGEIERWFEEPARPTSVETCVLADYRLDGHPCRVLQRRASFADGHIEVSTVFRALDLSGLALRIETETVDAGSRIKVTVEYRDVTTEVSPDEFNVPANFKKVAAIR